MTRFEETGIAMGDPDADLDALLEEQAALQAKIEDADAWNLQVLFFCGDSSEYRCTVGGCGPPTILSFVVMDLLFLCFFCVC